MIQVALVLILVLAGGLFLLFNGPIWVVTHARIFACGPESPNWLIATSKWASRIGGGVVLLAWLVTLIWVLT